jgi:hypothetical protein
MALIVFAFGVWFAGCGGSPQFNAPARYLLEPLQTAVSSKNSQWLDGAARKIDEALKADDITEAEHETMMKIVEQAKSGDWKAAQTAVFALSDGQRATSDDTARLEERERRPLRKATPKK